MKIEQLNKTKEENIVCDLRIVLSQKEMSTILDELACAVNATKSTIASKFFYSVRCVLANIRDANT